MSSIIDDTPVITENLLALAVEFLENYQDHYNRRWYDLTIAQISHAGYPCHTKFQEQIVDGWLLAGPALRAAHAVLVARAQKELPL